MTYVKELPQVCACGEPASHARTPFCVACLKARRRQQNILACRRYHAKYGTRKKPSVRQVKDETAAIEATLARLDAEIRARRRRIA